MNDDYYLAHEKLIEEAWENHYREIKNFKQKNLDEHVWGGGVFDAPPF
jgi:hypothetical protein